MKTKETQKEEESPKVGKKRKKERETGVLNRAEEQTQEEKARIARSGNIETGVLSGE